MVARHGLTEVYAPPEGTDTVALIIFVHGLFGHPYYTWLSKPPKPPSRSTQHRSTNPRSHPKPAKPLQNSANTQNENDKEVGIATEPVDSRTFWPRDLLPSVIHDARVFTWGYDADIDRFGSASQSTVHQHAGSLLSDIADQREISDDYRRPILFVVHSLGGIIVKAALNRSSATQGTRLKDITPATFGICFLGTPHRGSSSASLGKIAFNITRLATRRPNTRLLQDLERNSETLEQVVDTFRQTVLKSDTKLRVYSFREEKETRKYWFFNTIVVDAESAKIGDAHEEVGSIPTNHSQMTKFSDPEDIGFKRVAAQLRRWIQHARVGEDVSEADISEDCMASLTISETKYRIANVQKAYRATFDWLFDPNVVSFSEWLRAWPDRSEPIYWIQGKPGSGNGTLMKFAMKDSRTLDLLSGSSDSAPPWTFVAFFFHDRGSSIQKSLVGMLREIVDSILHQLPQLMRHAVAVYKDLVKTQWTRSPDWHLEALTSLMDRIISQRETRIRLLLFVDALDEHDGDNDLLIQLLENWSRVVDGYYVTLKICLASRSWPVFTDHFGHCPNFFIDHHTKGDIRVYTESRLNSSLAGSSQLLDSEGLVYLTEQITAKAQGVFIWVSLVADQLARNIRDGTPYQTLRKIVAETPEELQELYDHTLRRINPRYVDATHVMFQLVLCSIEPLPLDTLVRATEMSLSGFARDRHLNDGVTNDYERDSDQISTPGLLRWLISRGGGLLETYTADNNVNHTDKPGLSQQYVQFIHQTTKEYVQSPRAQAFMERMAPRIAKKNGFYFLTLSSKACSAWVAPIKLHMLYYAKLMEIDKQTDARIWVLGSLFLDGLSLSLGSLLLRALVNESVPCGTIWWLKHQGEPFLDRLLEDLNSKGDLRMGFMQAKPVTTYYRLLVIVAANLISMLDKGRLSEVELASIASPSVDAPCLLQVAIGGPDIVPTKLQDRTAMVVKLLSLGYPPNHKTFLQFGLGSQNHQNYDAGVPSYPLGTHYKMNAIVFLLCRHGYVRLNDETRASILQALIAAGAKLYGDDMIGHGIPLLSHCARYEHEACVRVMLEHGADTSERDPDRWLPLDYAILRGDRGVIAAFNDYGTEPLRPDLPNNWSPDEIVKYSLLCSNTVLSSFAHPGLAILMARYQRYPPRIMDESDS